MLRVLGALVLLLVLAGLIATGMDSGWTPMHAKLGIPLALLTVVLVIPTSKSAATAAVSSRR